MQKMQMSKNAMAATAAGIAAASVAAGAAAYYMNNSPKAKRRAMKKRAQKTMRTVSGAIGSAVDSMAQNLLG